MTYQASRSAQASEQYGPGSPSSGFAHTAQRAMNSRQASYSRRNQRIASA